MHRRQFLMTLAAASGLVLPLGRDAWAARANVGTTDNRRKLVVIMLRGAVDGMNVVAPVADPEYLRLRPTIGLGLPGTDNGVHDLDGYFALHPALGDLQPLWREGKLAFVHASGSPDSTRSHFDAQDYLESGTPGRKSTGDGWMNRLVAILPGQQAPTRAISIGAVLPRILAGQATAANIASGAAASKADLLDRPAMGNAFNQLYQNDARLARAYLEGRDAHRAIMSAATDFGMQAMQEMQQADGGAPLPNGFPDDAARLATLMRNDPAIQFAFMALGGWDTHANQGGATGQLANRLKPLGLGLATLARRLGPLLDDTTVVVMSEFGRTAKENGNGGTDHGHGNVMWVMGGSVAGGKIYGDWHGLSTAGLHEGRDLQVTTDFRTVLSQVASHHLRLDDRLLSQVFPEMPSRQVNWNVIRA